MAAGFVMATKTAATINTTKVSEAKGTYAAKKRLVQRAAAITAKVHRRALKQLEKY